MRRVIHPMLVPLIATVEIAAEPQTIDTPAAALAPLVGGQ